MFVRALAALMALSLLTPAPGLAAFPGDNGRIVYSRFADNAYDLFTIRGDGSERVRLTKSSRFEVDPAYSPNGDWIVFSRTDAKDLELFKIRSDGAGEPIQLTFNSQNDMDPAWSPSGDKIVFVRQEQASGPTPTPAELYKIGAGGKNAKRILQSDPGESAIAPAWSPDGARIAFCFGESIGDLAVHSITPSGKRLKALTNASSYNCDPDWSPDGKRIAFYTDRDGDGELFRMLRDGKEEARITDNSREDQSPVWSPNGAQILYARYWKDFGLKKIRPDGNGNTGVVDQDKVDEHMQDWASR